MAFMVKALYEDEYAAKKEMRNLIKTNPVMREYLKRVGPIIWIMAKDQAKVDELSDFFNRYSKPTEIRVIQTEEPMIRSTQSREKEGNIFSQLSQMGERLINIGRGIREPRPSPQAPPSGISEEKRDISRADDRIVKLIWDTDLNHEEKDRLIGELRKIIRELK